MKKPIAIDLDIIIDPYKLLSIINCINKNYSEIIIPSPLSYIEIWHPKWRAYTFKVFEDDSLLNANLEDFFGYTNGITNNNFIAGIKLLRMAYDQGMVRIIDYEKSCKYETAGKELLQISGNFNNIKKIKTGFNQDLYINPDYPITEMLYGMQNDNIPVIYGNKDFISCWNSLNQTYTSEPKIKPTPFYTLNDGRLQALLSSNKINNLSDAFEYANSKNFIKKLNIELRNTINDYQNKKAMFLLTLEYISTTGIDMVLGYPIATTAMFSLKITKSIIKKNKE